MRVPRAMPQTRRARPVRTVPAARRVAGTAPAPASSGARQGRAPRAPFVLLLVGLLCGGLVSLLLLNTILAQDSFRANELRDNINQYRQKKEELKHLNAQMDTPEWLAKNAERQGQEPDWDNTNVITLDRSTSGQTTGGSAGSRAASDGQTPAGQERVPGTGR